MIQRTISFVALLIGTFLALLALRYLDVILTTPQIASVMVFSTFIYGTLLFSEFRLAFAFGGIAVLLASRLLTVTSFIEAASLDVIIFLVGTFLVIGFLEENLFFEHVIGKVVSAIGPRPQVLLLAMMFMASVASALVGEVTAILFMAGAMLHLCNKYKVAPTPFVIMLVFASNIGSAASSVGNPIGVLIALKANLTFGDFVRHAAPVAVVVNVATYLICRWWYAKPIALFSVAMQKDFAATAEVAAMRAASKQRVVGSGDLITSSAVAVAEEEWGDESEGGRSFAACYTVFGLLIALLCTHGLTERLLGLHEGTMMVAASLIMGSIVLFIQQDKARELVERRIDWWTLLFFMMLFASVGTLEHMKVTDVIASQMAGSSNHSPAFVINIVGWATGWLSAFLDNVLAVATFMPVVHDIRAKAAGDYSSAIYWMMLFGGTFMGNMTIIGSTANIVAVGLLEKRGHGTVKFLYWFKIGFVVSIASMLIAMGMMAVESHFIGVKMLERPM